jgi:polyisoprenoid-binding protein YceI
MNLKKLVLVPFLMVATCVSAQVYNIDPSHTYPSFEADHMGLSIWRGKFTKSSGKIVLDRQSNTGGSIEISIDASSVDFGHAKMNEKARSNEIFNVAKYPTIIYKSTSLKYQGDKLVAVEGEIHPLQKREVCGADAQGRFDRSDFGMNIGLPRFSPEIKLAIQVEGVRAD